jgi:glycosyltransferase involved in cell wall biosynthesis
MPRVSILLPVHQAEATLAACLASIERQRETNWECIVVDDGSRDGSAAILQAWARRDDRVHLVTTPHRGLVSALETGLARCTAPWVARMDADDCMHRDRLAEQLRLLALQPQLAGVGCRVRIFPRADLRDGRREYERWLNSIGDPTSVRREAFVECPIAHPTLVVRRDLLERFGYRDRGWPEDYDLVLRLLAAGCELAVHPRRLLAWRDAASRLSRNHPAYATARFTDCKAEHIARGFLAESPEYILWGYGETGHALRRALAQHGRRPSHIVELHPRRIGNNIHGALVVPPEALHELPRRPLVASVAGLGPRERIRQALAAMGFREGRDFICAA